MADGERFPSGRDLAQGGLDTTVAQMARVYDYWLGRKLELLPPGVVPANGTGRTSRTALVISSALASRAARRLGCSAISAAIA